MKVKLLKKIRRKAEKHISKKYEFYKLKGGEWKIVWHWSEPPINEGELGSIKSDYKVFDIINNKVFDNINSLKMYLDFEKKWYIKEYIRLKKSKGVRVRLNELLKRGLI